MATLLQSLDSDQSDNIKITQEMHQKLANTDLDLNTASEEDVKDLVDDIGATYVNEEDAMEHVQDMLVKYTDMDEDDFDIHIDDKVDVLSGLIADDISIDFSNNNDTSPKELSKIENSEEILLGDIIDLGSSDNTIPLPESENTTTNNNDSPSNVIDHTNTNIDPTVVLKVDLNDDIII